MSPSARGSTSLMVVNSTVAAVALIAPWSGVFIADPVRQIRLADSAAGIAWALGLLAVEVALLAAMLSAGTLAMAWGADRTARQGDAGAPEGTWKSIAAHAAIGWGLVAGVVWSILTIWFMLTVALPRSGPDGGGRALGEISSFLVEQGSRYGLGMLPTLIFGFGTLSVARLVWLGTRACRFANAPQPTLALEQPPTATSAAPESVS